MAYSVETDIILGLYFTIELVTNLCIKLYNVYR